MKKKADDDRGTRSGRLLAELCNRQFLKGFVFHSPKYYEPTEKEAGDVVLWVRRQVVAIELVTRCAVAGTSTKHFIKRISAKRNQLVRDFEVFSSPDLQIDLRNEQGERTRFAKPDIFPVGLSGIVLVDCSDPLEKLHFETVRKSLASQYPIALMTVSDFKDVLDEVDTVPDLFYYLNDRFAFLKRVFFDAPKPFLDLSCQSEKNLIAHYKMHECSFSETWLEEKAHTYFDIYTNEWAGQRYERDLENQESFVIDSILNFLRGLNGGKNQTLYHSWELAMLSRRQRAGPLAGKIADAFRQLQSGRKFRYFAFFNQATGCWLVFLFSLGGDLEEVGNLLEDLCRLKNIVEIEKNNFEFSVFGYGFRKSLIETGAHFDNVAVCISDSADCTNVSSEERDRAFDHFGASRRTKIREFPS